MIGDVLASRAEELFFVVKDIVNERGLDQEITGGYVITGGGALVKNLTELAEYILEKPVKIGFPQSFGGMTSAMQHPKFSTVLGLLQESHHVSRATAREEEKFEEAKKLKSKEEKLQKEYR